MNKISENFLDLINNCNGSVIKNKLCLGKNLSLNTNIIDLTGSNITFLTQISQNINLTITPFDRTLIGSDGRVSGLGMDNNHQDKILHAHYPTGSVILGNLNMGQIGSFLGSYYGQLN